MTAEGLGGAHPVADSRTSWGRAANRRIADRGPAAHQARPLRERPTRDFLSHRFFLASLP